jgi:hypothetical protein
VVVTEVVVTEVVVTEVVVADDPAPSEPHAARDATRTTANARRVVRLRPPIVPSVASRPRFIPTPSSFRLGAVAIIPRLPDYHDSYPGGGRFPRSPTPPDPGKGAWLDRTSR